MIDYELESLFEQDSVHKQLVIELSGGTTLTNADIVSESLKLQESICSEQNLTFGSCEASVISFQTVCLEDLVGQTMNVSIILNGNTEKPFVLGEYKVASCKLSDDRKRRNVTAYDKIYDFINRDVIEWYNQLFPTASTTKTVKQIRDSLFTYLGITQETTTLVNDSVVISKTISADTLSGRDVIKCILEMNGCFGHIGRDGKFHYITLKSNNTHSVTNYKTIKFEEYQVSSIDCVAIRESDTGVPTVIGNPGNAYYIEDNFLLYGKDSTELTTIGQRLLPLMTGIVYTPYALTKRANPCYEVGDNVDILYQNVAHITSIITKREISGIQGMLDVVGATGDKEQPQLKGNNVQAEITKLKSRQSRIETSVDGIIVDISAIEGDIDSIEEEQSTMQTQIEATAEGLSTKVEKNGIISAINQSAETIDIKANRINLNGVVTANNNFKILQDGSMEATNGKFSGSIESVDNNKKVNIKNGNISFNQSSAIQAIATHQGTEYLYNILKFAVQETGNNYYVETSLLGNSVTIGNPSSYEYGILLNAESAINYDMWFGKSNKANTPWIHWRDNQHNVGAGIANGSGVWYLYDNTRNTSIITAPKNSAPTFNGQVHWNNITNKPNIVYGYAVSGSFYPVISFGKFADSNNLLANSGGGNLYWGGAAWSDRRLKENIEDTKIKALDKINNIHLVEFDFKDTQKYGKHKDIGYIAQELKDIIPECVLNVPADEEDAQRYDTDHLYVVEDKHMIPYLVKAIQEQSQEINELKATISDLVNRIEKLENQTR